MTDKEKLPLYVDQLISKGNEKIDELSAFDNDNKISAEHSDKIRAFQYEELKKITRCRTAIVLLFANLEGRNKMMALNEKLDDYQKKVENFIYDLPH